jgi:hypothetical protein
LLLLEAEHHFAKGDFEAAEKYGASCESARNHRRRGTDQETFEAFYNEIGRSEEAIEQYALARACYGKWGASGVLENLSEVIKT